MANNVFYYDSNEKPKPFYKSCFGMFLISILAFIILSVIMGKDIANDTSEVTSGNEYTEPPINNFNWQYSQSTDAMDGSISKYAEVKSTTSIQFDFPHDKSDFTLVIRKSNIRTDIYLTCTDCHFLSGFNNDRLYRVKCYNGSPFKVGANSPSAGGVDIVFLGSVSKILKTIRNCESLSIEAEFYDYGTKVLNFDVSNLEL